MYAQRRLNLASHVLPISSYSGIWYTLTRPQGAPCCLLPSAPDRLADEVRCAKEGVYLTAGAAFGISLGVPCCCVSARILTVTDRMGHSVLTPKRPLTHEASIISRRPKVIFAGREMQPLQHRPRLHVPQ